MIVDDSLTVRTIFKRMVESDGAMEIAGTASSAERALAQLAQHRPDVILLDLEMPGMGGLEALPRILQAAPGSQVLVISSLTEEGAEATIVALSNGAADTMLKPRPGGFDEKYRTLMLAKIRAMGNGAGATADEGQARDKGQPTTVSRKFAMDEAAAVARLRPELVAIGASTGGIHALNLFLRSLPAQFDLPVLITQHLPATFIPVFCRQIETMSGRPTRIAEPGTVIDRGGIFVASGHGHLVLRRSARRLVADISTQPTCSGCLPSVDPMLASVADVCDGRALAIILSGMGRDGVRGAGRLHAAGGTVWAQDADTSAVWGMPGAVSTSGLASLVTSPEGLAQALGSRMTVCPRTGRESPAAMRVRG